jgi:hypothetical protein
MKKQQWQVLVFLTLLLAAASAVGETNRGDLNVNIPFAFVVGNQTLPPGHYVVTRFNDSTRLCRRTAWKVRHWKAPGR